MMFQGSVRCAGARLVWKAWAPRKVKFFASLGILGRLWTSSPREVWWRVLGVQPPPAALSLLDWWMHLRARVRNDFHKGLDSLILLTTWRIWLARIDIVFNGRCISYDTLVALIREDVSQWCHAGTIHLSVISAHLHDFSSVL